MMHLALTVMLLLVGGLNRMTSGCMKGDWHWAQQVRNSPSTDRV